MKKLLSLLVILTLMPISYVRAEDKQVDLVFFWGNGCPHCENAKPFLKELETKYPSLVVHSLETWRDADNAKTFQDVANAYNTQARGVPAFFIGSKEPLIGYSPRMRAEFIERIEDCLKNGCENPLDKVAKKKVFSEVTTQSVVYVDEIESNVLEKTVMYFFWGEGCPHCEKAKPFLKELEKKFPTLEIRSLETWKNPENGKIFEAIAKAYNSKPSGVPAFFIGDNAPIYGFADSFRADILTKVRNCVKEGCSNPAVKAGIESNKSELCVHLFYRPDCPHCLNIKGFLEKIEDKKTIKIYRHNVYEEDENNLFNLFKENYGLTQASYPIVFVGGKYFVGQKSIAENLEKTIDVCKTKDCPCPVERILGSTPIIPRSQDVTPDENRSIDLPFFGEVNLAETPLVLTTSLIALVDGFNPCSTWLIMFLLGMVIHTRSRKKILIVSLTFLSITALAYGTFMLGLLNVFTYVGYLKWIQVAVAMMALLFAIVNIKDYFWFKKGISFTISDKHKPSIFKDMREIIKPDKSTFAMMCGTAMLALGVVLVELPCTAGFPVIWANMLAQNNVHGMYFILLFILYIIIYLLDELAIILVAVVTLKTSRFEEKHGRILKLIGGLVMASLAGFMLFAPDALNSLRGTLSVFIIAGAASVFIILLHRKILPRFGIKIGSEKEL